MVIADALEEVTFSAGQDIVVEGEDGFDFFIIVEGSAVVTQLQAETGEPVELARLGSAQYFGEISLLLDQPRAATVTALELTKCVKLDRARWGNQSAGRKYFLFSGILFSGLKGCWDLAQI